MALYSQELCDCFFFSEVPKTVRSRSGSAKAQKTKNLQQTHLQHLKYSVFGLGSSAYPHFCAFSHFINDTLNTLGATRIFSTGEGDELHGQEESFRNWAKKVYQVI